LENRQFFLKELLAMQMTGSDKITPLILTFAAQINYNKEAT